MNEQIEERCPVCGAAAERELLSATSGSIGILPGMELPAVEAKYEYRCTWCGNTWCDTGTPEVDSAEKAVRKEESIKREQESKEPEE